MYLTLDIKFYIKWVHGDVRKGVYKKIKEYNNNEVFKL
jgi:uncharacterized phage-associated protein